MGDYPTIGYRFNTYHFGPNGPSARTEKLIHDCYAVSQSVQYRVSVRFAFYRLWEKRAEYWPKLDGSGKSKESAYQRLLKSWSKAIHDGFFPADTFADESRSSTMKSSGEYGNELDWLQSIDVLWDIESQLAPDCSLNRRQDQDYQVILVFEANAMFAQFAHYAEPYEIVDLFPFGGQPSNPYKWSLAQRIGQLASSV